MIKGERTLGYLIAFLSAVMIPAVVVFILYLRKPYWSSLCYMIVPGYFVMYIFVMLTGSTTMVFTYILPMLSLLVLYHHPNLILWTGVASLIVNLISIVHNFNIGMLNLSNSKDAEIQVALIVLCFGGSYVAAKLYDEITQQNNEYMQMLNKKNEQIQEMTTNRIYRKRLTNEEALSELEKGSGTQFDPVAAGALIDMLRAGTLKNLSPDVAEWNEMGQKKAGQN